MFVGIDPDLHDLAIGFWNKGKPVRAEVIHVTRRKGLVQQEAVCDMVRAMWALPGMLPLGAISVAIEAQSLQRQGHRQHKRPQDIVILGNVAGAALGIVAAHIGIDRVRFPAPELWKGQIPKAVMQARLYDELGWGYEMVGKDKSYARPLRAPSVFDNISAGQWKHIGDALLLARWAEQQQ